MRDARELIVDALRRGERRKRGLRIVSPSTGLAEAHMMKARHNLRVMDDLNGLGHTDWVLVAAYYATYHGATAILARIGLESKEHATTSAALEYLFGRGSGGKALIEERYLDHLWAARNLREATQYGTSTFFTKSGASLRDAKGFVLKMRSLLRRVDDKSSAELLDRIAACACSPARRDSFPGHSRKRINSKLTTINTMETTLTRRPSER